MNKNQKLFVGITGTLAIIMFFLLKLINNQPIIDFTEAELQWIEDYSSQSLSFFTDGVTDFNDDEFISSISDLTGLQLINSKNKPDFVISNNPSSYYFEKQSTLTLTKQIFSYYDKEKIFTRFDELSNLRIGILLSDSTLFSYDLKENKNIISIFDSLESLKFALSTGTIDGFFLQSDLPLLLFDGQINAISNFTLKQTIDDTFIALPDSESPLYGILVKSIKYLELSGKLSGMTNKDPYLERRELLAELLTDEEIDFISTNNSIAVGLTPDKPFSLQKESQLYGATVGIIKEIERLSGLKLNLIIGEDDKLISEYQDHKITILTFKNENLKDFQPSLAYLGTPYIVVGLPDSPNIDDLYGLRAYNTGILFKNELNPDILAELTQGNITYNAKYDDLIQSLLHQKVDFIILPRYVLKYYTVKERNQELSIIYAIDDIEAKHLYVSDQEPLLQSIINKVILVTDTNKVNSESLNSIPEKERKSYVGLILLSAFVLLNLIFFGGYYIRYLINRSENDRLTYLFSNDQLTYLPNKYGLTSKVDSLISDGYEGQMYYINIDNFKDINDRLGQQMGDQIILEYAQELMVILDDQLILGRISGASFILVAYDKAINSMNQLIDQIKNVTEAYCDSKVVLQHFTACIAITKFPEHGKNFEELYKYAEHTMDYIHNFLGIDQVLSFEFDIYDAYVKERELVEDIKRGLVNEEFILYVQPQLLLPQEKVIGGEVLVRWQHPEKGLVFPNDFLPVAERNGLMKELDFFMLKRTCSELKRWQSTYPHLKISVNMTSTTFTDKAMITTLAQLLEESEIDPTWLTIEVTEDMGFENFEKANEIFKSLRTLSVKVALDDFGKGYSSLGYLEKLSFDILKIDKTFIDNIHINKESFEIYKIITQLADVLNISIVAEGVEYIEQVALLKQKKGTVAQGYYYSRPIDLEAFDQYLIEHH